MLGAVYAFRSGADLIRMIDVSNNDPSPRARIYMALSGTGSPRTDQTPESIRPFRHIYRI